MTGAIAMCLNVIAPRSRTERKWSLSRFKRLLIYYIALIVYLLCCLLLFSEDATQDFKLIWSEKIRLQFLVSV